MGERVHESTAALTLLKTVDLTGRLVTSDDILTQFKLANVILNRGGDYLMVVKGNTLALREDISFLFTEPHHLLHLATAQTTNMHGDWIEVRRLWASSNLIGYLEWPSAQLVLRQERTVIDKKTSRHRLCRHQLVHRQGKRLTSPRAWRGHWKIEGFHWIRDVTLGEDHSQGRTRSAPSAMASLRNVAIGLIRSAGHTNVAAACRHHAAYPEEALALLNVPRREN
jgi:predicted transposase YbfD/YdcC